MAVEFENEQQDKQQYGSFSNKDLFEFMMQFNSADELHANIFNDVLEFKRHVRNMIENVGDLFNEYLFPNLFNSVQVKIEMYVAHKVAMSATIGDENSDAVVSRALNDMNKEIKEMEKEAE